MLHLSFSHSLLWPAFAHLSPRGWALAVVALFLGGVVKGVVSIGVPLVAIPLLTGILSVKQAVLLLSMPIILGNIPQALEGGKTWPSLKSTGFLVIGAMAGIALGVKILFAIPAHLAVGIAGIILALAALALLFAPKFSLPNKSAGLVGLVAGFISGLMEGVSAIPGPLLATYLIATVAWLAASWAFGLYVGKFAAYSATYGPLATMIGLMMWFYISAYVVLFGAEFNAALDREWRHRGALTRLAVQQA